MAGARFREGPKLTVGAGHSRRDKAAQVKDTGAGAGAIRTIETTSAIVLFCFLLFT